MRTETTIVFEDEEIDTLDRLSLALYVGWPEPDWSGGKRRGAKNDDARAHVVVRRLGKVNERWTPEQLLLAREHLIDLVAVCEAESRAEHWTDPSSGDVPESSVGIIANPRLVIETLVEAREKMLEEAKAALALVNTAIQECDR